jgi:type I restriction enzyme S subunit
MKVDRIWDAEDHLTPVGAKSGTRLVPAGTVLFVVRGMILAKEFPVALTKVPVAFNQDLKAVKCCEGVDAEFLFYWLKANSYEILGRADEAGHGTKRLQTDRLLSLPIALPEVGEQRRIAGILSAYDDLIENCQRRIKILEEMARSLYREWFVHFRYPGHESVPLVPSPLGPIPKGWKVRPMGEVVELVYGKALRSEDRAGGDVAVYGSSGIVGAHNEVMGKGPGIIVGRKGNVGSVFWSDSDYFVIDTAYYVRSTIPLPYLYYDLQYKSFLNSDSAVPGLSRAQAYTLPTLTPCGPILRAFVEHWQVLWDQRRLLLRESAVARATRDLLLTKLIGGESA